MSPLIRPATSAPICVSYYSNMNNIEHLYDRRPPSPWVLGWPNRYIYIYVYIYIYIVLHISIWKTPKIRLLAYPIFWVTIVNDNKLYIYSIYRLPILLRIWDTPYHHLTSSGDMQYKVYLRISAYNELRDWVAGDQWRHMNNQYCSPLDNIKHSWRLL